MNQIVKMDSKKLAMRTKTKGEILARIADLKDSVAQAQNIEDFELINARSEMLTALVNSQTAAKVLEDEIQHLRQLAAEERIRIDRKLSELARQIPERPKRVQAFGQIGIPRAKIPQIERVGNLPQKQVDVYLSVKRAEGTPPRTNELSELAKLPPQQRGNVLKASIGDHIKKPVPIAKAIQQAKKEPPRATSLAEQLIVKTAIMAKRARELTPALVRIVKLAQVARNAALLLEIKEFDELWSSFRNFVTK